MNKRHGFTMVEMQVVVGVGSTLLMLAVALVHQSMIFSNTIRSNCERLHATNRFMDQFRQDVHKSDSVMCPDSQSFTIDLGDSNGLQKTKITYICVGNTILREEILLDGKVSREELVLGDQCFGSFEVDSKEKTASLCIQKNRDTESASPNPSNVRLDRKAVAVIGRMDMSRDEPEAVR